MADFLKPLKNSDGKLSSTKIALAGLVLATLTLIAMFIIPFISPPTQSTNISQNQSGTNNVQQLNLQSNVTNNFNYYNDLTKVEQTTTQCSDFISTYVNQNDICTKLNSGDVESAIEMVNKKLSTQEGKTDYFLWYVKSVYEHNNQNYQESITSGLISIQLNPGYAPTYENVADSYHRLGNDIEAKKYTLLGLELDPNSVFLNRDMAFILFNEKNYSGEVEVLNRALLREPSNTEFLANKALALLKLGNLDLSLATYLHSEEMGDQNPQTYQNIAYLYAQQNNIPKTVEYSEKFRQVSGNSSTSLCNLKMLYNATENSDKTEWLRQNFPELNCSN